MLESKVMTESQRTLDSLLLNRPQSLAELAGQLSPEIHGALKSAIELRKWNDGTLLNSQQLENCLQLVILYESQHLPAHERTGLNIPNSCKSKVTGPQPVTETQSLLSSDKK